MSTHTEPLSDQPCLVLPSFGGCQYHCELHQGPRPNAQDSCAQCMVCAYLQKHIEKVKASIIYLQWILVK